MKRTSPLLGLQPFEQETLNCVNLLDHQNVGLSELLADFQFLSELREGSSS